MTQHKCADCAYFKQGRVVRHPNPEKGKKWVDCVMGNRVHNKTNACPDFRESEA